MSKITVAPPIPGLWTIDKNVWKIKRDGRIVNRLTGELHPNQVRDLEAKELEIWTASGKRWTVNEAGKICDADTGEAWDLSRLATASVKAGKRGPRLSAFGQKKKGASSVSFRTL